MRAEAGRQRWSGGHAPNRPPRGLWPHVRFGTIMRGRTRPRSPGVPTVSYTDRQPRCGKPAIPLAQAATHNILYARLLVLKYIATHRQGVHYRRHTLALVSAARPCAGVLD